MKEGRKEGRWYQHSEDMAWAAFSWIARSAKWDQNVTKVTTSASKQERQRVWLRVRVMDGIHMY